MRLVSESVLPGSLRGIRYEKLETEALLEMLDELGGLPEAKRAARIQKETVARCVVAVTHQPLEPIIKTVPVMGTDGKPLMADGEPVTIEELDLDAMLIPLREKPEAWLNLNYIALMTKDVPTNMLKLFSDTEDWGRISRLLTGAADGKRPLVPLKARRVSI